VVFDDEVLVSDLHGYLVGNDAEGTVVIDRATPTVNRKS
jgi:hypothetical protein